MSETLDAAFEIQAGLGHHRAGRLEAAERRYQAVLASDPGHAEASRLLGLVHMERRAYDAGVRALEHAVAADPEHQLARENLAVALVAAGRPGEALLAARELVRREPLHRRGWLVVGKAAIEALELPLAISALERAVAQRPDWADAHFQLAMARFRAGELRPAVEDFRRALRLDEALAEGWHYLGRTLDALGSSADAIRCLEGALRLDPASRAAGALLLIQRRQLDWTDEAMVLPAALARIDEDLAAGREACVPPVMAQTLPLDPGKLLTITRNFVRAGTRRCVALREALKLSPEPARPRERLRLAYLMGTIGVHPIGHLMRRYFDAHDRSRFEVTVYSFGEPEETPFNRAIRADAEHFVELDRGDVVAAARRIQAQGVDILMDLRSVADGGWLELTALAPAPVKIAMVGNAGSSGSPELAQYLIADRTVVPPGAEDAYEERILRLPHCYLPTDGSLAPGDAGERRDHGLPDNAFVFCCFNAAYKLTPVLFDRWLRVLRAVPESVLWLMVDEEARLRLQRRAVQAGVNGDRLVFAGRETDKGRHLGRYRLADLFLDSHPYGAHTTAVDALAAGLPLLTFEGETFASRVAASALRAVELPELIVADADAYEREAVRLGNDRPATLALRRRLEAVRSRGGPLFDQAGYLRALETGLEQAFARAVAGKAPADITVPPA